MVQKEVNEPIRVPRVVVIGAQFDQLQQHGGEQGLREDGSLLDAAFARPKTRFQYQEHQISWISLQPTPTHHESSPPVQRRQQASGVRRRRNLSCIEWCGARCEGEVVDVMIGVDDGTMDEPQLAEWFREKTGASA